MHAVFVLPRFYPYRGGYENSLLSIARCLVNRGHRATVCTTVADDLESLWVPGHKTFSEGEIEVDGVRVRRFAICYNRWRRRATRLAGMMPYWRWKAQYWTPGFRVPGLQAALREMDGDVFHIGPLPYNNLMYAGLQAAEFRKAGLIATPCLHLGEMGNDAVAKYYAQPYQIAMLERCDRVLCMTVVEERWLGRLGVGTERLAVLPYGTDLELATGGNGAQLRTRHQIDGPVVLHLGMKAYEKGSVAVVEAMKGLWERGSKAWLIMAGPSLSEFDRYMELHGSALPRLVNLPAFRDEEKRDLLAVADVVAQPSRVESLGLVLVEAWANAKPVIAADIEVSRQLVEESGGGTIVPFGASDALANAIEGMLGDAEMRRSMGLRGQEFAVARFDSGQLCRRAAEVYEQVAEGTGLARR